jgi:hypothetical protein
MRDTENIGHELKLAGVMPHHVRSKRAVVKGEEGRADEHR